jgi:hypothetical protein
MFGFGNGLVIAIQMRRRPMRKLILAMALCVGLSAHAQHLDLPVYGPGLTTCAGYIADLHSEAALKIRQRYFIWAQGFITGLNYVHFSKAHTPLKNILSIPLDGQMRIIDNYCLTYPEDMYLKAAAHLWDQLSPMPEYQFDFTK